MQSDRRCARTGTTRTPSPAAYRSSTLRARVVPYGGGTTRYAAASRRAPPTRRLASRRRRSGDRAGTPPTCDRCSGRGRPLQPTRPRRPPGCRRLLASSQVIRSKRVRARSLSVSASRCRPVPTWTTIGWRSRVDRNQEHGIVSGDRLKVCDRSPPVDTNVRARSRRQFEVPADDRSPVGHGDLGEEH